MDQFLHVISPAADPVRLRQFVTALATGPRNRAFAGRAMLFAEAMVADALAQAGAPAEEESYSLRWTVARRDPSPLWLFRVAPVKPYRAITGANLHAVIEARGAGVNAPPLVLVAHLDTVRSTPGADDNASGVAVLVEAARHLTAATSRRETHIVIVDMEEIGFIGADQFVKANVG